VQIREDDYKMPNYHLTAVHVNLSIVARGIL
jgi:hypothetical protein